MTEKAQANRIESIQNQRNKELSKVKKHIQSLKELMKDEQNALQVKAQLEVLLQLSENATALHQSLMCLIPPDEQRNQNEWFTSITGYNQGFVEDVEVWISETIRPRSELTNNIEPQEVLLEKKSGVHEDGKMGQWAKPLSSHQEDDQDDILPRDSISNLSSRKQGSNVSTTSSACLRARGVTIPKIQ